MSHSQTQHLPSFKLVLPSDHHKAILPNLSYPSRPHSHIWSRSLPPLCFAKNSNVHSHPTMAFSYASATATDTFTTNNGSEDEGDTGFCSVPHAFRWIQGLITYNFCIFTGKLKLFFQKLVRTRSTAPSIDMNSSE